MQEISFEGKKGPFGKSTRIIKGEGDLKQKGESAPAKGEGSGVSKYNKVLSRFHDVK